jgi:PAS domain S-box-containing protein
VGIRRKPGSALGRDSPPPSPPQRGWRLTAYFAALVAVVALAAAAGIAYVSIQTDRDSRDSAERSARFAATTAAGQLGEAVATTEGTVSSLAAEPNLETAAERGCALTFGLGRLLHGHLAVLRPDGTVACSSPRGSVPKAGRYADAPWLRQVGHDPVVLGPTRDPATQEPSMIVARRAPSGWVVAAFVPLGPVARDLVRLYGGGHPVEFLVTTADGRRVITRSIAPHRWIGRTLAETPFRSGTDRVERRDVDGRTRLYQEAGVTGTGWRLYAGEDEAAALAVGNRLRERQLAIILGGLALVFFAAWIVYRRVAVPTRRLATHVRLAAAQIPPVPVPVAGPAEVAGLANDINGLIAAAGRELRRRQDAEEDALSSARSYRLLFEESPLPIWIHDAATGAILAVNDAAVTHYGYSRAEFVALNTADLDAPPQSADDTSSLPAIRHVRKDGRAIEVRTVTHAVSFEGHDALCVVVEDVGERERLERQRRQGQKMEAVGQLAGGLAHDFNNLLTVIAGYSGIARDRIGAGPGAKELAEIDRAAERARQLTQQLLAFSRQQVLEPVLLDLNEVIDAITPMLGRLIGDDIEIGVIAGDDLPTVLADRGQIEQVIVNLAVNARDAMPGGGTMTIETGRLMLDEQYVAAHPGVEPGLYTCLSVTDTGTGIAPEEQGRIFEPFFTTKPAGAGTGLGLATVHGIVEQSGGHIELYSESGLGTSFKVYVPAAEGEAVVRAYAAPERPGELDGTETILVCDDDDLVRLMLETILTAHGYSVRSTSRADEALAIGTAPDGVTDVLITDSVMPQMTGVELIERLRAARPELKMILISGYSPDVMRERGLPAEIVFLQKPFDDVTLLQRIRGLIDGHAERGRPQARERLLGDPP